jgi:hypothetical protein
MISKKNLKSLDEKYKKVNLTKKNKQNKKIKNQYIKKTRINKIKGGGNKIAANKTANKLNLQIIKDIITNYINNSNIVVDPAGTSITNNFWVGGGVSGAIYEELKIDGESIKGKKIKSEHNLETIKEYTKVCHNKFDNDIDIIHVHSPDGKVYPYKDNETQFKQALKDSYKNIFNKYLEINNMTKQLILVQISGAIFAGDFEENMPEFTIEAINEGFRDSNLNTQDKNYNIILVNKEDEIVTQLNKKQLKYKNSSSTSICKLLELYKPKKKVTFKSSPNIRLFNKS